MSITPIQSVQHWHELRKQNVGGSEVAALFNACSYLTALELYLIKSGQISGEIVDNDRMLWGRLVEDAIAQGVAHKTGWTIENTQSYYTCDDVVGMGCTPDRFISNHPSKEGEGLLQIKNTDWLVFKGWEDGEPPLQYQLQLQHELACTGLKWGALAVLVGGNDLKIFEFEAHAGVIAKIKREIAKFWAAIETGKEPQAIADDYEILKELHRANDAKEVDLSGDNELPTLCATALEAAERRKAAEKEEKTAKATILQKIGDAGIAKCSGFYIKKATVSKKEYVCKATTYQTLSIKEAA